jgi:hypothetical protein
MAEPPKKHNTGQHLRLTQQGDTGELSEVAAVPNGTSDLDLLPRRFDFFASEVRDFMSRTGRELARITRLESEHDNSQQWAQKRYVLLVDKIDALDKKLDAILSAVAKGG